MAQKITTQAQLDAAVNAQRAADAARLAAATAKGVKAGRLAKLQAAAAAAVQKLTAKGSAGVAAATNKATAAAAKVAQKAAAAQSKTDAAKSKADARAKERADAAAAAIARKKAKADAKAAKRGGANVITDPAIYYGQQDSNAAPDNTGSITGGSTGGGGGGAGGSGAWDADDGDPGAPVLTADEFEIGGHVFNKKAVIIGGVLTAAVGLIVLAAKHK